MIFKEEETCVPSMMRKQQHIKTETYKPQAILMPLLDSRDH